MLFTSDYEERSGHSLFMAANVLRVIDSEGTPAADLPRRAGVAKEATNLMIGPLHQGRHVVVEADPRNPRRKVARLTPDGAAAKAT
jgi:hypothetical protein